MKKGFSFFLGLGLLAGSLAAPATAFATDASSSIKFNDGANGASTYTAEYDAENDITTMYVDFRFDGAALEKVLNQKPGVGSYIGDFYATINPGYGFGASSTNKIYKSNVNYNPKDNTLTTAKAIEQAVEDDIPNCSKAWTKYGENFCGTKAYSESSSDSFWNSLGTVFYKHNDRWIPLYYHFNESSNQYTLTAKTTSGQTTSIKDRLLEELKLESESDLEYGENWVIRAKNYGTAWIYRDNFENPTRTEYFKFEVSTEFAFDYMSPTEAGDYVRHDSLEDALESDYDLIIVNKDTTVESLVIPEGVTVVEREGKITITDYENSSIEGNYTKADGEDYHLLKISQPENGLLRAEEYLFVPEDELELDLQVEDGYKLKSVKLNDEEAELSDVLTSDGKIKVTMPDEDLEITLETEELKIEIGIDENDDLDDDSTRKEIADFASTQVANLMLETADEYGYVENEYMWVNKDEILRRVTLGETLKTVTEIKTWEGLEDLTQDELKSEIEIDAEAGKEIVAELVDGEEIIAVNEVNVWLHSFLNGQVITYYPVGAIYSLEEPIEMSFEIPEAYRKAPEGYERTFYVIRGHLNIDDEESAFRIIPTRDGNNLVFENDKFSTFIITYVDEPIAETPETGFFTKSSDSAVESNLKLSVVLLAAVLALFGARLMNRGFAGIVRAKNSEK